MRCTLKLLKLSLCPSGEFNNFLHIGPGHFVFLLIFLNGVLLIVIFSKECLLFYRKVIGFTISKPSWF